MLFLSYILTSLPPIIETILDASLLVLITTPMIYFKVISPYIVANDELLARIHRLALIDELTQLGNRRALIEHFNRFLSINIRQNNYGALLSIDLDKFKIINDEFGHDAGDAVLVEVARRLTNMVRKANVVCRIGGDEFIILLNMIDDDGAEAVHKAQLVAQRIINSFMKPIKFKKNHFQVGVSIGLKIITPELQSIESVLKDADIAMYKAKKLVDQKICVFDRHSCSS